MTNEAQPPADDGQQPPVSAPPVYQQPPDQQPASEQPVYQQPPYQQPPYQQPASQQPVYQQPVYQQPVYQQPTYVQPMYQDPYAVQPMPYAAPRPTNVLAVITLVLSLVSVSIGAVITGHISLGQIRRTGEQGHGMALAGLIIGYAGCALWVILWIVMLVLPVVWLGLIASVAGASST